MPDFSDPSGLSGAYDRAAQKPNWTRIVGREDTLAQAADLNDLQTIVERRHRRVGNLIASDGDRVSGADILVDVAGGSVTLAAGRIYARGDVREVAAAILTGVPMAGEMTIGIRIASQTITEIEDPDLLGLQPGSWAEGEPGSARISETIAWGRSGDGAAGDLIGVYLLRDGTVIDQTPPPSLSGINQAIAVYDRQAHGNYIVEGCRVTALGKVSGFQQFSIEEGVANIWGFKVTRSTALRHAELETYDLASAQSEPHVFSDGGTGTAVIALNHTPLAAVATAIITREVTETKTRGTPNNTADLLDHGSVTAILEVKQGATTYAAGTDYTLSGDYISWTPAGAEPTGGSSYTVKYRYLAAVAPDAATDGSVTLSGGVTGTSVFLTYDWKLPRVDRLCLDQNGLPVYVCGISARSRPAAPAPPSNLLPLATVTNNWTGKPAIENSGVRAIPYDELWRYVNRLIDMIDLVALERLQRQIDSRDPIAKRGVFVDPFTGDDYRDSGEPQTAAVYGGVCRLAIDPTFYTISLAAPATLAWTPDIIVRQELATVCVKVNPYQNFTPIPAELTIDPAADFWTESVTEVIGVTTNEFTRRDPTHRLTGTTTTGATDVIVDRRAEIAEFLRQIEVSFLVQGFGAGETLASLTFDAVDVTPAGPPVADASGRVSGSFTIPANITAGQKAVIATGGSGSTASAVFTGQGEIDVAVARRTITTTHWIDPQAQTATLTEGRHIAGIDLKFCAIGDPSRPCIIEIRTVENGEPTGDVVMASRIDMATVVLGAWTEVRFDVPLYQPADREFVFVVKTDDAAHSISAAAMGDFDPVRQAWVSAQPYTVGVRLSSSNASTWTAHQDSDLTFRIVAASFSPLTRSIDLGSHNLVDCSDLMIRAVVDLPTAAASMYFEVERTSGEIIRLLPDQVYEFQEYVTENVALRAVLTGSAKVSPILYPVIQMIAGKIRASGTYVSRAMEMGTGVSVSTLLDTLLPAGSTLTVEQDAGDDNWVAATLSASAPLNDGWVERTYAKNPYTAVDGRLRLTLTGGPAARPALSDLRSWVV